MTDFQKQLVEEHLYLVPMMVSAMTRSYSQLSKEESEELTQIGCLALCRAAVYCDPDRDFAPYAKTAIRHAIYDYWRQCRWQKEHCCSLDELLSNNQDSGYEQYLAIPAYEAQTEQEGLASCYLAYLDVLSSKSSTSIQKGIATLQLQQQGYKSTELARLYGVPANHIRAWQSKARKKLQQDQELYALLA